MHADDTINRVLIAAMLSEHAGHGDKSAALIRLAASLHIATYSGLPSYFGDRAPSLSVMPPPLHVHLHP